MKKKEKKYFFNSFCDKRSIKQLFVRNIEYVNFRHLKILKMQTEWKTLENKFNGQIKLYEKKKNFINSFCDKRLIKQIFVRNIENLNFASFENISNAKWMKGPWK